jgi:hypothetical protein
MNEERIIQLLKSGVPPQDSECGHDLWPQMMRRLASEPSHGIRLGPWEWALAALVVGSILLIPGSLVGLLCQF